MSDNTIKFDVIKLLREIKTQGIQNIEIKYGEFELKIQNSASEQIEVSQSDISSPEQIDEMESMEQRTISERIKERDESLLDEIDFIAPELAGELRRSNTIKLDANNCYEYVEGDAISG